MYYLLLSPTSSPSIPQKAECGMDYRFARVKRLEGCCTQLCKPLDQHSYFLPQVDDAAIKKCEPHKQPRIQFLQSCLQFLQPRPLPYLLRCNSHRVCELTPKKIQTKRVLEDAFKDVPPAFINVSSLTVASHNSLHQVFLIITKVLIPCVLSKSILGVSQTRGASNLFCAVA